MSQPVVERTPTLPSSRDDYTIGIVCALPHEANAVISMFDYKVKFKDQIKPVQGDRNAYTFGVIGQHHVVLAVDPQMGKVNTATVGVDMARSFPKIELCMLVGICAIVPTVPKFRQDTDALLGDVVLSTLLKQYDFGKQFPTGFQPKDTTEFALGAPRQNLQTFFASLQIRANDRELKERLSDHLLRLLEHRDMIGSTYPGYGKDCLYRSSYVHEHHDGTCDNCKQGVFCSIAAKASCKKLSCDEKEIVTRERIVAMHEVKQQLEQATGAKRNELESKLKEMMSPEVFLGAVGCADTVMKSGVERDRLAERDELIAFEMEGAGLWNTFSTVVIKGACDYGDSHKNNLWHDYAAATAAACAKAFLEMIPLIGNATYDDSQQTIPVAAQDPTPGTPSTGQKENITTQINNSGTFTATKMFQGGTYHIAGNANFG